MANAVVVSQINLILDQQEGLEGAEVYPDNWAENGNDAEYLYRRDSMIVRDRDVERVVTEMRRILRQPPGNSAQAEQQDDERRVVITRHTIIDGVVRLHYTRTSDWPIPRVLDELDNNLGVGVARPDHVLHICPNCCPATEPEEVRKGTVAPFPSPAPDSGCDCADAHRGGTGAGVFVSVVDTGFLPDAATAHSWLAGVEGDEEDPFDTMGNIREYAGHGTFVAGCLRCTAPQASVYVDGANLRAGAVFESEIVPQLAEALGRSPDVVIFTVAAASRKKLSLLGFDALYESHIRHFKGLAFLSPADNSGTRDVRWPAAYPWAISVGALSANWRDRADFSNFGGWVDVYAPGEGLVNAFATGVFVCKEPPNTGVQRQFEGMARWSGTSFSTPLVAGLIAARMSVTGENGQQAAESLLRFARSQTIPGVGAILLPGQECSDFAG